MELTQLVESSGATVEAASAANFDMIACIVSIAAIIVTIYFSNSAHKVSLWEKRYAVYMRIQDMSNLLDKLNKWFPPQTGDEQLVSNQDDDPYTLHGEISRVFSTMFQDTIFIESRLPIKKHVEPHDSSNEQDYLLEIRDCIKETEKQISVDDVLGAIALPELKERLFRHYCEFRKDMGQSQVLYSFIKNQDIDKIIDDWKNYVFSLVRLNEAYATSIPAEYVHIISSCEINKKRLEKAYYAYVQEHENCDESINVCVNEIKELAQLKGKLDEARGTLITTSNNFLAKYHKKMKKALFL